jgi:signal transduction histidine kinase
MVSGYLGLLRRRHGAALGADADALIAQAVEGAGRMRTLIDDLLAYSQVGRDAPAPRRVDPEAIVADVADVVRASAPDAEIDCGPLPAVCGDPALLRQLFQNLLGNAVKFVPEGRRARVRVRARGDRFEVEDNGIGIDPEDRERIFRMFQRLDTRDGFAGTGIGLAVARKVVERHGGTIWVEPGKAGGSRFCFTLPVVS